MDRSLRCGRALAPPACLTRHHAGFQAEARRVRAASFLPTDHPCPMTGRRHMPIVRGILPAPDNG